MKCVKKVVGTISTLEKVVGTCPTIPPSHPQITLKYVFVLFFPDFFNTNSTTVSGFVKDNEASRTEDLFFTFEDSVPVSHSEDLKSRQELAQRDLPFT